MRACLVMLDEGCGQSTSSVFERCQLQSSQLVVNMFSLEHLDISNLYKQINRGNSIWIIISDKLYANNNRYLRIRSGNLVFMSAYMYFTLLRIPM